jgi:WD40 repeat protein
VAASGGSVINLWDRHSGEVLVSSMRQAGPVWALAFSPDGRALASACEDGTTRLWEAATGRPLCEPLQHAAWVHAIAFSPDGLALLTASRDRTARVWDVCTGKALGPPLPHAGPVRTVAFRPGGRAVLTAGDELAARLWPLARPVEGGRERLALWVRVLTALELEADGVVRVLDGAEWLERRRRLDELGGAP